MKVDVVDFDNKKIKDLELDSEIFGIEARPDIVARVVKWQLAKMRCGNHKVKNRSDVKHTTRKPFKQKGTGRARQGMTSVPNMRGGGIALGPVVRDHSHKLQKKVRILGLKSTISSKIKENNFMIMQSLDLDSEKTADLSKKLQKLGLKSVLFVDTNNINDKFKRASANIVNIDVIPQIGLNVYDILRHEKLICTEIAIKDLMERLNGNK